MSDECLSCGRNTAPGTRRFSARKKAVDTRTGTEGFLCHACQPGSAAPGPAEGTPLSGRYVVIDLPGGLPGH